MTAEFIFWFKGEYGREPVEDETPDMWMWDSWVASRKCLDVELKSSALTDALFGD